MAKPALHQDALKLRIRGYSIGEIASALRVSKSTVSQWCRDITPTPTQIRKIAERSNHHATFALLKSAETQRKKRHLAILTSTEQGMSDVGLLTKRDIQMVGLGLYWGEGYKKGSQEFGFTNSDSELIKFYIRWLRVCFDIDISELILRVSINAIHSKRVDDVLHYWRKVTGVPASQFTKTSLIKSRTRKYFSKDTIHYGTLRIKVRKGTNLRRRVLGSIRALSFK
jgi:transcriptional regulator with XRE-family HTH domain